MTERERLNRDLKEIRAQKSDEQSELKLNDGEPSEEVKADQNEIDEEDIFKRQTLHEMMDGVIEMSWQEIVKKGVELPSFVVSRCLFIICCYDTELICPDSDST